MTKLYLEPRYLKVQYTPLSRCPRPQYNERCMGIFLKTRRWQIECVECMKRNGTLSKHPLLAKLMPPQEIYKYHGVMAEDIIELH